MQTQVLIDLITLLLFKCLLILMIDTISYKMEERDGVVRCKNLFDFSNNVIKQVCLLLEMRVVCLFTRESFAQNIVIEYLVPDCKTQRQDWFKFVLIVNFLFVGNVHAYDDMDLIFVKSKDARDLNTLRFIVPILENHTFD